MPVSFNDKIFVLLINSALWKTKLPIAAYEHISRTIENTFITSENRIDQLVYDAIDLPTQQLPRNLHLRWVAMSKY